MKSKKELIRETIEIHKNRYLSKPDYISIAPGRINIIGEHTDYNYGLAMPAAIDRYICVTVSTNNNRVLSVYSKTLDESFSDSDTDLESKTWSRYVLGCIHEMNSAYNISAGMDIAINSTLEMGKGISSSAALEISIVNALSQLFNLRLSDDEIIEICQQVDHRHVGINSGKLDFSASLLSKDALILSLDFLNNSHSYIKSNLEGCDWVLVDSGIRRELVGSKYLERVEESQEAWSFIGDASTLKEKIKNIETKDICSLKDSNKMLYNRLYHVITENTRVKKMESALTLNQPKEAGSILTDSHLSLRDFYEVSCHEIDYIIEISKDLDYWYGGRIMGGGFGGSIICLLKSGAVQNYSDDIKCIYKKKFGYSLDIDSVLFTNGAEVLDNISAE